MGTVANTLGISSADCSGPARKRSIFFSGDQKAWFKAGFCCSDSAASSLLTSSLPTMRARLESACNACVASPL